MNYLTDWKAEATELWNKMRATIFAAKNPKARNQASKQTWPRCFLSRETFTAIKVTTQATVCCIRHESAANFIALFHCSSIFKIRVLILRYLLRSGFHYVLTRKFNSDSIEAMFSEIRAGQGHNDQANAVGVAYSLERKISSGIVCKIGQLTARKPLPSLENSNNVTPVLPADSFSAIFNPLRKSELIKLTCVSMNRLMFYFLPSSDSKHQFCYCWCHNDSRLYCQISGIRTPL